MILNFVFVLFVTTIGQARAGEGIGIIIAGGSDIDSVEVFDPSHGQGCQLPSLPEDRYGHSMEGLTICGGNNIAGITGPTNTTTTCITFSSGQWVTSHHLVEERIGHSSWAVAEGTMLVGGDFPPNTTEIVKEDVYDGVPVPGFNLQKIRPATCSIPDQTTGTLIITGGRNLGWEETVSSWVTRYDTLGFVEDLPSMNIERYHHGCGAYLREDGTQVLLVAGGYNKVYSPISSTELLTSPSSAWVLANNLPRPMYGIRGVTVSGVLYMTGFNEVYSWTGDAWLEAGKMKERRDYHAVSTIQMDNEQIMEYCT